MNNEIHNERKKDITTQDITNYIHKERTHAWTKERNTTHKQQQKHTRNNWRTNGMNKNISNKERHSEIKNDTHTTRKNYRTKSRNNEM